MLSLLVEGLLGHSELQYKFRNLERGVSPPFKPFKSGGRRVAKLGALKAADCNSGAAAPR